MSARKPLQNLEWLAQLQGTSLQTNATNDRRPLSFLPSSTTSLSQNALALKLPANGHFRQPNAVQCSPDDRLSVYPIPFLRSTPTKIAGQVRGHKCVYVYDTLLFTSSCDEKKQTLKPVALKKHETCAPRENMNIDTFKGSRSPSRAYWIPLSSACTDTKAANFD